MLGTNTDRRFKISHLFDGFIWFGGVFFRLKQRAVAYFGLSKNTKMNDEKLLKMNVISLFRENNQ